MRRSVGRAASRPGPWALAAALILVGGFLVVHASWCRQAIRTYNGFGTTGVFGAFGRPVPAPLNRSAFLDGDSYAWVDYAARIARGETFRVRRNERDNYPFGREVHWSSGYSWILAAAGWARKLVVGGDIGRNVESAALLVNPLLYFLFLALAAALTARSFGSTAATLLVLAAGGAHELYFSFFPGRPDHHGLIAAAAWGTVFCLIAGGGGWVRAAAAAACRSESGGAPDRDRARRWFVASAVLGGAGFWVSALTQSLVTAAVCAGVVVGSFFVKPGDGEGDIRYRPELWRLWGRVGAAVCVFFYLLEYFPGRLAWRLEVNHPLYALAWWGCGELLANFLAWKAGTVRVPRRRDLALSGLAVAAVSAIPLIVKLGGERFYLPLDPLWVRMLRMVLEQRPPGPSELLLEVGALALAAVVSAVMLVRCRPDREALFSLAVAATCCLLTLGLALGMRRWIGLFEVMLVLLVTVCATRSPVRPTAGAGRRATSLLIGALLLAQFGFFGYRELATAAALKTARTNAFNLMEFSWLRTVAEAIRAEAQDGRAVVLSDPGTCEVLSYFGGFNGITSQYWENLEGLRGAADIYTAKTDAEALALIRRRGITHIALIRFYEPSKRFFELKHGRYDPREAYNTFGSKMHVGLLPSWLTMVPLHTTAREFTGLDADIFKVDPARLPGAPPPP